MILLYFQILRGMSACATGREQKGTCLKLAHTSRIQCPLSTSESHTLASDLGSLPLSASHQLEGGPDIPSAPFSPDDQLLIYTTPPRLRFEVCWCPKECIVAELQNSASLYPLRTKRGHHYIDSTSKGISGGQYVNRNTRKTKKWQPMGTWKQTVLED